ncbi:MAG TPA: hypothetical protein VL866_05120, partial [Pyrinomonadaceae bacterium]|nr:hypothetical protein [Pyrinomonadaceae bacterium]
CCTYSIQGDRSIWHLRVILTTKSEHKHCRLPIADWTIHIDMSSLGGRFNDGTEPICSLQSAIGNSSRGCLTREIQIGYKHG